MPNATPPDVAPAESPLAPPDVLWDDWETPPRLPAGTPELHLAGFDGPLDLLLDLAERERIDLARVSVRDLVDQFVAAMTRFERRVPLERRADWLVLVARLLVLRSRLFLAAGPEAEAAEAAVERERGRLRDLQRARAAAAWLEGRPQLGRDVFARGRRGRDPRVASYMRLMEACLAALRPADEWPAAEAPVYRPIASGLFAMDAVRRRLRALADAMTQPAPMSALLPRLPEGPVDQPLLARSAVSATLVGVLELCRDGRVTLGQDTEIDVIVVAPVSVGQRDTPPSPETSLL